MDEAYPIKRIVIGENTLKSIGKILMELGIKTSVSVICDHNTYIAAGKRMGCLLHEEGFKSETCIIGGNSTLIADERALGQILLGMDRGSEMLIAVGSGTINDLTRYTSYKTGIPYGVVATAPSMDGYASTVSPLVVNGFKRTYDAVNPEFIIGDSDILCNVPQYMLAAGFGDILGKFTSLADWKISSIINGEGFSGDIFMFVKNAVGACVNTAPSLKSQAVEAVVNVMKALVDSGIAMQQYGSSRPASGAEHHLAHYLEMKDMMQERAPHLHGTKVGVASVIISALYHRVFSLDREEVERLISKRRPEDLAEFKKRILYEYSSIGDEVLHDLDGFYQREDERRIRQRKIIENWDYMKSWVIKNVPQPEYIKNLLQMANAPSLPEDIGLDANELTDILINAREVRKRYTILRLAEDIGI